MAATRMSSPKSRSERRFSEIRLRSPHDSGAVDDADQERLARDMRTHVTRFFKGPADFEALMEHVFPALLSQPQPEVALRIWTPGCGTGEETYSVAIALYEFLGTRSDTIPIQIFGTDISQSAINAARFGLYSDSIADDLSPRLQRYFIKEDRGCRIRQDVRELCVFAEQDLTRDPPFSRLDLVLWRDVLVLLSPVVQRRVLSIFHYALKPSGFLMLGETESVESVGDLYSVHDKKKRIYTRKPIETPRDAYVMGAKHLDASSFSQIRSKPEARSNVQSEMNRIILDRFGPPGVMVDADYQIVHVRGD